MQDARSGPNPLLPVGADYAAATRDMQAASDAAGVDAYGVPLWWRTGDVAVVCNHRWAHGRPSYALEEGEELVTEADGYRLQLSSFLRELAALDDRC